MRRVFKKLPLLIAFLAFFTTQSNARQDTTTTSTFVITAVMKNGYRTKYRVAPYPSKKNLKFVFTCTTLGLTPLIMTKILRNGKRISGQLKPLTSIDGAQCKGKSNDDRIFYFSWHSTASNGSPAKLQGRRIVVLETDFDISKLVKVTIMDAESDSILVFKGLYANIHNYMMAFLYQAFVAVH